MSRTRMLVAACAAALSLVVVSAAFGSARATTLTATVGPGFTITLKKGSAKVGALKAGAYKIVVADKSAIHNFHLIGPGVNKDSGVAKQGTSTWTVTLKKGTYKYVCDPHASIMKGSFKVT
jgi:plastocyanin